MTPIAQSVASQLGQLVVEGLIVTVGVTLFFSLGLSGVIRMGDARREGHTAALIAWGSMAVVAFAGFAAFVVLALLVVTHK